MASLEVIPTTVGAIENAVAVGAEDPRRPHLGASVLGNKCDRALWYSFRWCTVKQHTPRMLRLFARGQREEDVFVDLLRKAGITVITVDPNSGAQFRYSDIGGHIGGSMDGAALGVIEAPKTWHVLEFKTHGDKSFTELVKKRLKDAKPQHRIQVILYMHWSGMERTLYLAVNKNDDNIYMERVEASTTEAKEVLARAKRIVEAATPPAGISVDPTWYECKMCDHYDMCHGERIAAMSCRTCLHATPELDGNARWSCAKWGADIPDVATQRIGCPEHRYIPQLIQWAEVIDVCSETGAVMYRLKDGQEFWNGPAVSAGDSYESEELQHCTPSLIENRLAASLRETFSAKVVSGE